VLACFVLDCCAAAVEDAPRPGALSHDQDKNMGLLDKLKGAVHAVTGGAATVEIQYAEKANAGAQLPVRVTVTSKGAEIKSKGVFVDFEGVEKIHIPKKEEQKFNEDYHKQFSHSTQTFQLTGEFVLGAAETKVFEGNITIPPTLQPAFEGRFTKNLYQIRGRLEAKGNDPDSGYKPIRVIVQA
jgi:predicted secreted protein